MSDNLDIYNKIRLEDLYIFKILCETRNFSKTAEITNKSQSSISIVLNRLEEAFSKGSNKIKLVNRTSRKFSITADGKNFLIFINSTLNNFEKLLINFDRIESFNDIKGKITISSSTIPEEYILPKLLMKIKLYYPNVEFITHIKNSEAALEDLKNDKVDFAAIGIKISEELKDEYDIKVIGDDEILFICSSGHELPHQKKRIKVNDLYKYQFIVREEGSGTRKTFEDSKYFNEKVKIAFAFESNQSILTSIINSNYIAVLSKYTLSSILNTDLGVVNNDEFQIIRPIDYEPIVRSFYLVKKKSVKEKEPNRSFWEFIDK